MNTPSLQPVEQIKPLTSIRGIAALWVYFSHCQYLTATTAFFAMLTGNGYFGVDIFFILSGFILSHVHLEDFTTGAAVRKNYVRFQLLRLARIYPLQLITLLVVLLFHATDIFGWPKQDSWSTFFAHVILLQATGWWGEVQSWNLVSWSISVEWMLYLAFPIAAWLATRSKPRAWFGLLLAIAPIIGWVAYFHVTGVDMTWMHEAGRNLIRGALDFTIGIGLYTLYRARFLSSLPWDALCILSIIAVLLVIAAQAQGMKISGVVYVGLFTVLIYALANLRGFADRIFSVSPSGIPGHDFLFALHVALDTRGFGGVSRPVAMGKRSASRILLMAVRA